MPAPRAVLRDIADLGLDPKKAHSLMQLNGRLNNQKIKKQKALSKPALVRLEEPVLVLNSVNAEESSDVNLTSEMLISSEFKDEDAPSFEIAPETVVVTTTSSEENVDKKDLLTTLEKKSNKKSGKKSDLNS
jgi:hypothetical protein